MWSPTHVQVTVQRAKNLLIKGKNGTNNPFVTIAVGKEKYQTSVKEKEGGDMTTWQEQCELTIPKIGNTACIVLTALHRNNLNLDEFLGTVSIPLASFDVYERPRSRWYKLEGKPGKEKGKDKERGELEVRIAFTVKASTGSLMDLSKKEKHKSSLGHLSSMAHSVGGSLLSLGSGEKRGIKQIAKSLGKKVSRKKRDSNGGDGASEKGSLESMDRNPFNSSKANQGNVDPGVISEDEDEFTFDNLSHKSSGSSLNVNNVNNPALENLAGGEFLRRSTKGPTKPPRILSPGPEKPMDEWEQKLFGKGDTLKRMHEPKAVTPDAVPPPSITLLPSKKEPENPFDSPVMPRSKTFEDVKFDTPSSKPSTPTLSPKPPVTPSPRPVERKLLSSPNLAKREEEPKELSKLAKKLKQFNKRQEKKDDKLDRFIVGEESTGASRHSKEVLERFEHRSKDELIDQVLELERTGERSRRELKELQDYLDQLLLRVMETTPRILQNPYISCKTQANLKLN